MILKYFAGFLTVCSVLPALVIMPATCATLQIGDKDIRTVNGRQNYTDEILAVENNGKLIFSDRVVFKDNGVDTTTSGGAYDGRAGSDVTFHDLVKFDSNIAASGSALSVASDAIADIKEGAIVTDNTVATFGAFDIYGRVKARGALQFSDNHAIGLASGIGGHGGALNIQAGGDFTYTDASNDVLFSDNMAFGGGGAIYNADTAYIMANAITFRGNQSGVTFDAEQSHNAQAYGGAIFNNGTLTLIGDTIRFEDNRDNGDYVATKFHQSGGGAINSRAGTVSIGDDDSDVVFRKNSAVQNGGAIVNRNTSNMTIDGDDIVFDGNRAEHGHGGAIYNYGQDDAWDDKATPATATANLESPILTFLGETEFTGNSAFGNGGAIWNGTDRSAATATIVFRDDVDFIGNTSNMDGGAIYNGVGGILEFQRDAKFQRNIASGLGNDIHNMGIVNITGGRTTITGGITGDGELTIGNGAELNLGTATIEQSVITVNGTLYTQILNDRLYGRIIASDEIAGNGRVIITDARAGTYEIFNQDNDLTVDAGFLYNVKNNGASGVVISTRTAWQIADDTGLDVGGATVAIAMSSNRAFTSAYRDLVRGISDGTITDEYYKYFNDQAARALPYDKPVLHSVTTATHALVADLSAGRMALGRAGGDMSVGYGAWIQGMHNTSKYSDAFTTSGGGFALGIDGLINRTYTIGVGYANNNLSVDANNRDIDVESHALFAYAQYKPNKWFVNMMLSYATAEYNEETTMFNVPLAAEYDVDSYRAQIMTGYDFATGITTRAGMRYLYLTQDDYSNGLLNISGAKSDFATLVGGLDYAFDIQSDTVVKWSPEFHAAATYDFVTDDVYSTVVLPGIMDYRVRGGHLSRMGGEFGFGLGMRYGNLKVSLNYELDLHKNYTSQSGILKLKYNF